MDKYLFLTSTLPLLLACSNVKEDMDIVYAEGLSHNLTSTTPVAVSLNLDVYYPDDDSTGRPVFMFIHGGGFVGGTKPKPEILDMADYYASRGWVFASIDYRTTAELGSIDGMTTEDVVSYYTGIAPEEWIRYAAEGAEDSLQLQQSIAMYTAQRDAKAALRWIVANSTEYAIDTNYITVGGASAGAITTIALGISNQDDFTDELSITDDPTLSTTNLDAAYTVQSMVYFWGSKIKLDLFEAVYGVNPYDANDPELFMAHGDADDPVTPYEGAIEIQEIYNALGIHNELVTLEGKGHGAWNAKVDGKGLFELSHEFLVERQGLNRD